VRASDATVCLISTASLSSSWVVFEAVTTLQKEHLDPSARLIACALDQDFFDEDFRLALTATLDREISDLNTLITQYLAKQLDMTDVSAKRSRLLAMRNALGDVLARLRGSLTLQLSPASLMDVATKVADHIRDLRGAPPSRSDPRDIRARAEELRRHLWEGRTDDALDRLLDFVREFSDVPKHVRDATFLANTLRRIERLEREQGLGFSDAETQRQPIIYKFLELIDEIEIFPQLSVAS
jgi:hypothetical protein